MTIKEIDEKIKELNAKKKELTKEIDSEIKSLKDEKERLEKAEAVSKIYPNICAKIDELFALPENEDCNIVILNGVHGDFDGGRELYEYDDWEEEEKVAIEIGSYNKWATAVGFSDENETALDKLYEAGLAKYIPSSEKVFGDDSGVNCYWHGIVALHKNHTIVGFICRDDNMMLNEYEERPDVLFDFNVTE